MLTNNIKCAVLLLGLGSVLGACNKQINGVKPYDQIDQAGIMASIAGIDQTAVANYAELGMMQGNFNNLSEFKGNTVTSTNQDLNHGDAYNYIQNTTSTVNGGFWQDAYVTIVGCNFTLQGIQAFIAGGQYSSLDSTTKATLLHTEGEMYFLRGLCYFNLVRLYAKPYYQSPSTNPGIMIKNTPDPTYIPGRSTVQDSYTQIVSDLDSASSLMSHIDLNSNVWASKEAAWALMCRVLLYKGGTFASPDVTSNTQSIVYADSVLNSGKFSLLTGRASYDTMFNNQRGNAEMIFASENQDGFPSNGAAGWYSTASGGNGQPPFLPQMAQNEPGFTVAPSFWKSFDTANDYRCDYIQFILGKYMVTKFLFGMVQNYAASDAPTAYLRLAEIYLNRAEAYFKTGNTAGCLADLNTIRVRAGLQPLTGLTGLALQDSLMSERRKELCFEGHASCDYFRNGLPMTRPAGDFQATNFTVQPTDNDAIFPLPESEILSNPKLVQNPM